MANRNSENAAKDNLCVLCAAWAVVVSGNLKGFNSPFEILFP